MKLIFEPSVFLLGRQTLDESALNAFLAQEGVDSWATDASTTPEKLCEVAGRLCYLSFTKPRPGGNKAYLDRILESSHGSVAEHAVWNFIFTGVSRSLTHELVRHRSGMSYSQLSQRYVDESVAEYVVPPELHKEVKAAQSYMLESQGADHNYPMRQPTPEESAGLSWLNDLEIATIRYRDLVAYLMTRNAEAQFRELESKFHPGHCPFATYQEWMNGNRDKATEIRKAARGAARSVLPNATETKIFVTANARSLRHCLEMRCSSHADVEIRVLFGKVYEILVKEAPNLFLDYKKIPLSDGTFEVTTPNRKV